MMSQISVALKGWYVMKIVAITLVLVGAAAGGYAYVQNVSRQPAQSKRAEAQPGPVIVESVPVRQNVTRAQALPDAFELTITSLNQPSPAPVLMSITSNAPQSKAWEAKAVVCGSPCQIQLTQFSTGTTILSVKNANGFNPCQLGSSTQITGSYEFDRWIFTGVDTGWRASTQPEP